MSEAVERIRSGPSGAGTGAFFDFTGTVLQGYSPLRPVRVQHADPGTDAGVTTGLIRTLRAAKTEETFTDMVRAMYPEWAGRRDEDIEAIARKLFERTIAGRVYPEVWQLIRAHLRMAHTLVLVTSGPRYLAEAAAESLEIPHVLATKLEVRDGLLTGKIDGVPLWRREKASAVRKFATEHDIDLAHSYGYSHGSEDIDVLSAVGNAVTVNPDAVLTRVADQQHWPVLRFASRGATSPVRVARTAAGYGGFLSAVGLGLSRGVLKRDHRLGVDTATGMSADVALRLAGITVRVQGEENARAPRPAVFIFNHQSQLDTLILAKVLRGGFTAIVKREMAAHRVFGPILRTADVVFINRADSAQAREALRPVEETLRGGLSIVIAPEGTRSLTPNLGPFKKGAFHIARQAEVPVIPFIIRNAGEMLWKHGRVMRGGAVDVVVGKPIDVASWDTADFSANVDSVREFFLRTLEEWPDAQ
ncbi:HAD-IB family hydrolase [Hoyosella sp. YIM 151337]|uniref:HAD-IB family hydrolase n=1 Tax=Hoyosella sp. YIM 151337 TaxID=2992742 RepID=UPI002235BA84|nr:HAD-IB family hydrolase [Hoyosella sp. YIM 151337]MCW4352537.1 HAD-IB family hydrolase [Hoyosella sp. YIM 151337]